MVEKATETRTRTLEWLKNLQWQRIFHMFYIEPVVFLLLFSHTLSGTITRNQIIYQTCTTIFHYNESVCKLLDSKNASAEINAIETQLQPYIANMFLMRTLLESVVPAFCGLFVGSWSDNYGRKNLLVVSMVGFSLSFIVTAVICQMSSYYVINPWWYIVAVLPHSLLGGNCVFSVAAFCFISDITDTKTRPYRMILMEALFFIGLTSGSLLSSFVYAATSAAITIGISGSITTFGTIFIIFFVPESLHYKDNCEKESNKEPGFQFPSCHTSTNIDKNVPITACDLQVDRLGIDCPPSLMDNENNAKCNVPVPQTPVNQIDEEIMARYVEILPDKMSEKTKDTNAKDAGLFSLLHIKEMVKTCTKERENHAREIIWLVTMAMFLSIFVFDGVMTVMYLFVREKFHWTVRDFTFFETVSHLVPMLGTLIGFLILRKVFRFSVVTLALLAFFSEILNNLTKGFASQPWHMYLAVTFGVFRSISSPMCRTIVSNIVPPSDLGKIFSIKNVLQSIAPFLAAPLYTVIYKGSLTTYPGLFNFLSAGLYFIAFIFVGCVLRIKFIHKEYYAKILK